MTQEQLHRFGRCCSRPLAGGTEEQRRLAVALLMRHVGRRTPARWLPDIRFAHSLPRYARAVDEILSL